MKKLNIFQVYKAVIKWVKYDETKRKHLLPDLMANVRLVYTSKDFLVQEVISDPLISSNPECEFKLILQIN